MIIMGKIQFSSYMNNMHFIFWKNKITCLFQFTKIWAHRLNYFNIVIHNFLQHKNHVVNMDYILNTGIFNVYIYIFITPPPRERSSGGYIEITLSVHLSVHLSVRLSVCPSVRLSVRLSVKICVQTITFLFVWNWLTIFGT